MRIVRWLAVLALAAPGGTLVGQDYVPGETAEARIWLDRGNEPLLQRGDRVRIYYRTSQDAYVAIFQINTDGAVRLLHPRAPEDETFTRGGRDYRLLFPQSSYWFVDEYPGKGYYFVVASPEPFDLSSIPYVRHQRQWDLTQVGQSVYQDPYLAMDDYIARLIPDWEVVPYALDFVAYDVGEVHEYPRFLCYDCHGYRSYPTWNPYTYACASFRVVVWDDPYFYAGYRYQGSRVVYAQPRRGVGMYEFKERAQGETWTPLVRTRQPPLRRAADYVEPGAARAPSQPEWVPPRRSTASPSSPGTTPSGSATPTRRPSSGPPSAGAPSSGAPAQRRGTATSGAQRPSTGGNTPATSRPASPSGRATPSSPPRSTGERPVLQRRPTTSGRSGGSTARPSSGTRGTGGATPSSRARPSAPTSRPSVAQPRARSGVSRPSSGASTRARAPSRSSGSSSSRPAVRPPARSSSGSARSSGSRPATRKPAAKPPPRRKPGGGGG